MDILLEFKHEKDGHYCFTPVGSGDFKKCLKLKSGQQGKYEFWSNRNLGFHRKYFSMINKVITLLPEDAAYLPWANSTYMRKQLALATGHYDEIIDLDGVINKQAKSISFKNMQQDEFEQLYSATIDAILKYILPHISQRDFEKHLLNYC